MKINRRLLTLGLVFALVSGAAGLACQKKGPSVASDTSTDIGLEAIHFDFDKYNIRSDAQPILSGHSQWIKDNASINVVVEGHTDEWGTEEYNMALGERRAVAAKNYLVNLGVSPDRLSTISYGESRPVDSGHSDSAWAQNRRDNFVGRK